jgi:hypothetical protein
VRIAPNKWNLYRLRALPFTRAPMPTENQALRKQLLALMQAAPIPDYGSDSVVTSRVGRLFAEQTEARESLQRFGNSK